MSRNKDDARMNIEIRDLTEETLKDAPEWPSHPFSCKYCIYWEFPKECVDPVKEKKKDMMAKKLQWLRSVNNERDNCGKIVYLERQSIGYAQYAPSNYLPGSASYDSEPPSDDALLLSCLLILHERFRGVGIGSRLLRSTIDELRERGEKAIETFARKDRPDNPSGPADLYLANGFRISRDDKEFPLMRLDL